MVRLAVILGTGGRSKGASVVRAGPAVSLCPYALRTGIRYLSLLVQDLKTSIGHPATTKVDRLIALIEGSLAEHKIDLLCRRHQPVARRTPANYLVLEGGRRWHVEVAAARCVSRQNRRGRTCRC